MFSTLPGVSAPPPFGGSAKSVIVRLDPEKIQRYSFTPKEVVEALANFNVISPVGNLRMEDEMLLTPTNSVAESISDFENFPLTGTGASGYLKDLANIEIASDVTTGYALVNGARSVYIPVTKRADASTWESSKVL